MAEDDLKNQLRRWACNVEWLKSFDFELFDCQCGCNRPFLVGTAWRKQKPVVVFALYPRAENGMPAGKYFVFQTAEELAKFVASWGAELVKDGELTSEAQVVARPLRAAAKKLNWEV